MERRGLRESSGCFGADRVEDFRAAKSIEGGYDVCRVRTVGVCEFEARSEYDGRVAEKRVWSQYGRVSIQLWQCSE
jgi:hypothetical protein